MGTPRNLPKGTLAQLPAPDGFRPSRPASPALQHVIVSPFAAARLRTEAAQRFKKVENATAMIWRLLRIAKSRFRKIDAWRRLCGPPGTLPTRGMQGAR